MKLPSFTWSLRQLYFNNPIYAWRLSRIEARDIQTPALDSWPGEVEVGRDIINGKIVGLDSRGIKTVWEIKPKDPLSFESLHGFTWLRHLRAQGGEEARQTARKLVLDWLNSFNNWHSTVWRGDILGERVSSWLGMFDFFCESASDDFRNLVLESISKQITHGLNDINSNISGIKRIRSLKGLIIGCIALNFNEGRIDRLQRLLYIELESQIFLDGGHTSRSPSTHIEFIMALIDIRNILRRYGLETSEDFQIYIAKMSRMLRLWRHGDGKLALFHNSQENGKPLIDSVLGQVESQQKTIYSADQTGFHKISAGSSNLIVDTGAGVNLNDENHDSLSAFEFSTGKQRLIVNCGTSPGNFELREALKVSSAHSMLTVDDKSIGMTARKEPNSSRNLFTSVTRKLVDGCNLIEITHEGYGESYGLTHNRNLYLSADGTDLRGEETLNYSGAPGGIPEKAVVRFHLHPRVRASLVQDGSSILLRPTSGGFWRFKTDSAMALEESLYLGTAIRQRTEQITVVRSLQDIRDKNRVVVRWALSKESGAVSRVGQS